MAAEFLQNISVPAPVFQKTAWHFDEIEGRFVAVEADEFGFGEDVVERVAHFCNRIMLLDFCILDVFRFRSALTVENTPDLMMLKQDTCP